MSRKGEVIYIPISPTVSADYIARGVFPALCSTHDRTWHAVSRVVASAIHDDAAARYSDRATPRSIKLAFGALRKRVLHQFDINCQAEYRAGLSLFQPDPEAFGHEVAGLVNELLAGIHAAQGGGE